MSPTKHFQTDIEGRLTSATLVHVFTILRRRESTYSCALLRGFAAHKPGRFERLFVHALSREVGSCRSARTIMVTGLLTSSRKKGQEQNDTDLPGDLGGQKAEGPRLFHLKLSFVPATEGLPE